MNKRIYLFTVAAALVQWSVTSYAQTSTYEKPAGMVDNISKTDDIGVGLKVGNTSGVNVKYWTDESSAWDGTVAVENGNAAVAANRLWQFRNAFASSARSTASSFVPYIGAGLVAAFGPRNDSFNRNQDRDDNFGLAAQVPLGIEFLPADSRFGAFAELTPGIGITPWAYSFVTAGLGGRLYF